MKKSILLSLLLPLVAFSQNIIVEHVSHEKNTLEAKRLSLIERQLGIHRQDFKIMCDFEYSGIAEVVALPSERVILSSKINGKKERKYSSSVVLTDPEFVGSTYRAKIHFNWFSERYESENKGIQTSVIGLNEKGMQGYNRFAFPQEDDRTGIKTVWVFSLRSSDGSWEPTYPLRIKPESNQSQ